MILPYRVKNPPERFPYYTLGLIAVNVLVYACTVDLYPGSHFGQVRQDALDLLAVSHNNMNPVRLITAQFLHGSFMHIAGNMWFLWIFGPSVEGRLKPAKFMALYLLSGAVGGITQDVFIMYAAPDVPGLGASGAIMGVAGAYLYLFPYARVKFLFGLRIREWHARWVVVYFLVLNFLEGMVSRALAMQGFVTGVGNFAHLGGMLTGFLFVVIARVHRDSEDVADAQAMRADVRDPELLTYYELEALMQNPQEDMRIVLCYADKAMLAPGTLGEQRALQAVRHYATPLATTADPVRLASILLRLSLPSANSLPSVYFLRLGSNLEHMRNFDMAWRVYRRLWEANPSGPDSEIALIRIARLMQFVFQNADQARYFYSELIRNFPAGTNAEEARRSLATLTYTDTSFR